MQAKDILQDFFDAQLRGVAGVAADLPEAAAQWRPDAAGNSIAITIWHLARVADFVLTHRLEGQDPAAQRWFDNGWAERTGYDPRGLGAGGMGILTGYSQEEVAGLPPLPLAAVTAYFDEVHEALLACLAALADADLDAPVPGEGEQRSHYFWLRVILIDATRHLGEMQALRAMWERQQVEVVA